jgi:pectinesterase
MGATSDTTSYHNNKVTITQGKSQDNVKTDDLTATLRAWGSGLRVYNINLVNTRGVGSQALALSAYGDQQGYYGVQLIAHQDTLLAEQGSQLYAHSLIQGDTDYIFGQTAKAWFEKCDLQSKNAGYITANGRDSSSNPSWYVMNKW